MLTLASYIFTARSLIVLFLHINYFVYLHTHTEERKRLLKVYKGLCCIVFQFGNNKYFNFYVLGKAWIWPWDRRGLASWRRLWWRRGRRWAIMEKIVMDVTTEKKIKTIIIWVIVKQPLIFTLSHIAEQLFLQAKLSALYCNNTCNVMGKRSDLSLDFYCL